MFEALVLLAIRIQSKLISKSFSAWSLIYLYCEHQFYHCQLHESLAVFTEAAPRFLWPQEPNAKTWAVGMYCLRSSLFPLLLAFVVASVGWKGQ